MDLKLTGPTEGSGLQHEYWAHIIYKDGRPEEDVKLPNDGSMPRNMTTDPNVYKIKTYVVAKENHED